jgi:hypothetical protein
MFEPCKEPVCRCLFVEKLEKNCWLISSLSHSYIISQFCSICMIFLSCKGGYTNICVMTKMVFTGIKIFIYLPSLVLEYRLICRYKNQNHAPFVDEASRGRSLDVTSG